MKHVESKLFNQNGHFYFSFQICITCTYLTNIFGCIYIYIYILLVSCFGFKCLDFEDSYNQLPGNLSPDYKKLHARQIPHQLSFPSQTIPDCIRYIIGVF